GRFLHADPDAAGGDAGAQDARSRSDLVWRDRRADHPDGNSEPTSGARRLYRESERAGRADVHELSGHLALLVRNGRADYPAADFPAACTVPAEHDVRQLKAETQGRRPCMGFIQTTPRSTTASGAC